MVEQRVMETDTLESSLECEVIGTFRLLDVFHSAKSLEFLPYVTVPMKSIESRVRVPFSGRKFFNS